MERGKREREWMSAKHRDGKHNVPSVTEPLVAMADIAFVCHSFW